MTTPVTGETGYVLNLSFILLRRATRTGKERSFGLARRCYEYFIHSYGRQYEIIWSGNSPAGLRQIHRGYSILALVTMGSDSQRLADLSLDGSGDADSNCSNQPFTPQRWYEVAQRRFPQVHDRTIQPLHQSLPSIQESRRHSSLSISSRRRSVVERDSDGSLRLAQHVVALMDEDIFNERPREQQREPWSSPVQRQFSYFVKS